MKPKTYLGDGVYAAVDTLDRVVLTVGGGAEATDTIYLEPEVLEALLRYLTAGTETRVLTEDGPSSTEQDDFWRCQACGVLCRAGDEDSSRVGHATQPERLCGTCARERDEARAADQAERQLDKETLGDA